MNRSPDASRRDPGRIVQLGVDGRTAVARVARGAVARDGRDVAVRHLADDVVPRVGDEQVARSVHRQSGGSIQFGARRRLAVARIAGGSVSRDGRDDAVGHLTDHVVACLGDEEITLRIHRQARGIVQLDLGGRAAEGRIAVRAAPGDGRDRAVGEPTVGAGLHLADHAVAGVGDEQVSAVVQRDRGGVIDLGPGGQPSIAGVARRSVAGHDGDRVPGHLEDRVRSWSKITLPPLPCYFGCGEMV